MPVTRSRGFTLVEMAIVLMIVAFLLGGLLAPLSAQLENQRIAETDRLLADVRDALQGFAAARGRLPCPAKANLATGSTGAGLEDCTLTDGGGVVPWADLGVRETDGWGRRLTYRVTKEFMDTTDGAPGDTNCNTSVPATAGVSFKLCSTGDLSIWNKAPGGGAVKVGIDLPAVAISHGANGFGAWMPDGTQRAAGSASADEGENFDAPTNKDLVSHPLTGDFDDQVIWVSRHVLANRMVSAGRLP